MIKSYIMCKDCWQIIIYESYRYNGSMLGCYGFTLASNSSVTAYMYLSSFEPVFLFIARMNFS